MKLIITENQFKKIIENKQGDFKQKIIQRAKDIGIYDVSREFGMGTNDFIDRFNFELTDSGIMDLIDFFMKNKFEKIYDLKEKKYLCTDYEKPSTFLNVVIEAICEFCYNNFNFTTEYNIDEEDTTYENLFYQMEYYITKKYGEIIKNKFNENCSNEIHNN